MAADRICFRPIGIIHSPFKIPHGTPIQPVGGKGIKGTVEIFPKYAAGLKDLVQFSYIMLIYNFHLSKKWSLIVKPFMDNKLRGVFATRAPRRPNPIGISVVRLLRRRKNILYIEDLDMVDGTPLLDIKPYIPEFDYRKARKIGWLKKRARHVAIKRADGRFTR